LTAGSLPCEVCVKTTIVNSLHSSYIQPKIAAMTFPAQRPLRRLLALLAAALLVTTFMPPAGTMAASPFPPQLPTPQEMAALQQQLSATLGRLREAQAELDRVVRDYEAAQDRLTQLVGQIGVTQIRQDALETDLRAAQSAINNRAASAYKSSPVTMFTVIFEARTYREFTAGLDLIRSVTESDSKALTNVRDLKGEAARVRTELEQRRSDQQKLISDLDRRQDDVDKSLRARGSEFETLRKEVERRKSGFAFPVKAPYSYTDSYGAPRMEGSKYYHRHEGTDIFALQGTPILAVVDGVIENLGTATLGGIKLWVRSPGDNWSYYYAHMSGYATGMANGLRVKKGTVVGYVGTSGNARGTPPHLHFETHVPAGPATNPYPILRRVDPLAR